MVPQPLAALDEPGTDEEGGGEAQLAQDRIRHLDVAAQAVVEGERDPRTASFLLQELVQRHDRERELDKAELALERRGIAERRAVVHQDAVVLEPEHGAFFHQACT